MLNRIMEKIINRWVLKGLENAIGVSRYLTAECEGHIDTASWNGYSISCNHFTTVAQMSIDIRYSLLASR